MADIWTVAYVKMVSGLAEFDAPPPVPRVKSDAEYMAEAMQEVEQLLAEWNGNG